MPAACTPAAGALSACYSQALQLPATMSFVQQPELESKLSATMQGSRQAARCVAARAEGGSEIKLNTKEYFDIDTIDGMIFDIDGTLVDSDPFHHQAFQELLQPEGFNGARRATVLPPLRRCPTAHVHHAALL